MKEKISLDPLISIIVPIYNVAPYLERCINSIINQTYRNLEIILVDDGSTDGSSEMCDMFQQQDKRIKVIHKMNGGLVSARKAGIVEAKGEYAAYVDSDDWIECDMYHQMVAQMILNNADIVTSGLFRNYTNDTVDEFDNIQEGVYDLEKIKNELLPVFMYTGKFYEAGINIHIYNKLFKRELLLKHQLRVDDVVRVGEDAALVYPYILDAKKIVVIHKCFYHYCIRQNSIMADGYRDELKGYKYIYLIIKSQIEKYDMCRDNLMMQLNYFMIYMLLLKEPQIIISIKDGVLIPFHKIKVKDRLVLYGGGKFGSTLCKFIKEQNLCEIVLWIDKEEDILRGIESSLRLSYMAKESYDWIILAVLVGTVADKIQKELIERGIEQDKIARINVTDEEIINNKKWQMLFEG